MPAVLTHGHPGLCAEVKEGCLMSFSVSDIWNVSLLSQRMAFPLLVLLYS